MKRWRRITFCVLAAACLVPVPAATANTATAAPSLIDMIRTSNAHMGSQSAYLQQLHHLLALETAQQVVIQGQMAVLQRREEIEQKQAVPAIRFLYQYEQAGLTDWMQMVFDARGWQASIDNVMSLSALIHHDVGVLQTLHATKAALADQAAQAASAAEDIAIAQRNIAAEQRVYARVLAADPQADSTMVMQGVRQALAQTWQSTMAPALVPTLTALDVMTNRLSDTLPKADVQIAFPHATVTIPEAFLNAQMAGDPALKGVRFLFRDGHLLVSAESSGHTLLMMGHFTVAASHQRANYIVDNVAVDGVLIPPSQASQWLSHVLFYIDVGNLSRHVSIERIDLADQTLSLHLGVQLS